MKQAVESNGGVPTAVISQPHVACKARCISRQKCVQFVTTAAVKKIGSADSPPGAAPMVSARSRSHTITSPAASWAAVHCFNRLRPTKGLLNNEFNHQITEQTVRYWCGWRGSNPRPLASEANTLSTELQPQLSTRPMLEFNPRHNRTPQRTPLAEAIRPTVLRPHRPPARRCGPLSSIAETCASRALALGTAE